MTSYKTLFQRYTDTTVLLKSAQYAKWTLAQLVANMLDEKYTRNTIERDFQSYGAQLVNNLATKLVGLLYPSSRPFFRIKLSRAITDLAKSRGIKEVDLQSRLARIEIEACGQLFLNATYANLTMLKKHLIVTGNGCTFRNDATRTTIVYGIASFVTKRDGHGSVLDAIIKEVTDFEALEPAVQMQLRQRFPSRFNDSTEVIKLEQYTRVKRGWDVRGQHVYHVSQEVEGVPVGVPGTYPAILCPWQFPTWSLIPGENYGRGLVEDYAGDFARLSDTSHAAALYGIAASKVVNLVAPGSGAVVDDLNEAETGEWVQGNPASVSGHEGGDAQKMQQMREDIGSIEVRLARAFMYQGNTREAERVTAYEIRRDAMEVDNSLGGVYSTLSASIQGPLAHLLILEVDEEMLEGVLSSEVKLDIVAGIPALGRQTDVQNLINAAQDAAAVVPVLLELDKRVDVARIMDIILDGHSVDTDSIFKDEQQLAEEQAAAQQEAQGQEQIIQAQGLAQQAEQLATLQQGTQ